MARHARFAVLSLMALALLSFYLELIMHSPTAGMDFAVVSDAARVLDQHGDIYNQALLWTVERQVSARGVPTLSYFQPYTYPPLLAYVVRPFAAVPVQQTYHVWALLNAVGALGASLVLTRLLLSRQQARWQAFLLFALCPNLWLCLYYGQMSGVIMGAFAASLALLGRRWATLAGAVLVLAWLKPQIYVPLAVAMGLCFAQRQPRFWVGLGGVTVVGAAVTVLTTGWGSLDAWLHFLVAFSGGSSVEQADFASLTSLYVNWLPHVLITVLAAVLSVSVLAGVGVAWWRWPGGASGEERWFFFSVVLTLWLLTVPYIHPHDDLLLLIPCLVLLGRAGVREILGTRRAWPLLIALWLAPAAWLFGVRPALARGLGWVPVLLVLLYLWGNRRRVGIGTRAVQVITASSDGPSLRS